MKQNPHIARAIAVVGSQTALAEAASVTQAAVWKWLHEKAPISADRALDIEAATGGVVTRHELRPDKFGQPPEGEKKTASVRGEQEHA